MSKFSFALLALPDTVVLPALGDPVPLAGPVIFDGPAAFGEPAGFFTPVVVAFLGGCTVLVGWGRVGPACTPARSDADERVAWVRAAVVAVVDLPEAGGLGLEVLVAVEEGREVALDDADGSEVLDKEEVVLAVAEVGGVRLAPVGAELATRFPFCCCSCCFFSSNSCFRLATACCRACWASCSFFFLSNSCCSRNFFAFSSLSAVASLEEEVEVASPPLLASPGGLFVVVFASFERPFAAAEETARFVAGEATEH